MNNIVRFGTVAEVRLSNPARVRVQSGELLTQWLPWSTVRAGKATVWWPPTLGEQVLLLSPGGDLAQAMVLPASFSDANPQPSESADELRIQFDNGDTLVHNHAEGSFALNCANSITLQAADSVLTIADGQITSNVDVVAEGISLVHHKTTKVVAGLGLSGEPE